MSDGVFVLRDDDTLVEMTERPYASEDRLQELLAKYPDLLAGEQIDTRKPRKWLLISREAGLPSEEGGSSWFAVDHLFIDQDAIPTLVEVKQSTNSEIRRSVVGQLLSYAAGAVALGPVRGLYGQYKERCQAESLNPEAELAAKLGDDVDPETFWESAHTNLQAGKIRLLFVSDAIPRELRQTVEFLNAQMDPAEVLAVEIKHYAGGGLSTLVPRVYGQTESAKARKGSDYKPTRWNEQLFFEDLAAKCSAGVPAARAIFDWANQRGHRMVYGSGTVTGSFVPWISAGADLWYQPVVVFSDGTVAIGYDYIKAKPIFNDEAKRDEMRRKLNQIDGVDIPVERLGGEPSIPLPLLADEGRLRQFLDVLDWFVGVVKGEGGPGGEE